MRSEASRQGSFLWKFALLQFCSQLFIALLTLCKRGNRSRCSFNTLLLILYSKEGWADCAFSQLHLKCKCYCVQGAWNGGLVQLQLQLHTLLLPSYTLCLYIYYSVTTPPPTAQLHTVPAHLLQCNYTPPTALQHTVPVLPLHCDSNPSYCHATHCTQHISCKEPVLKLLCK